MDSEFEATVQRHWFSDEPGSLQQRIDAGLVASGLDPQRVTFEDLSAVDEFHVRGREATLELAALAAFASDDRILDVGSGLGGPSRCLASHCGCRVTGIDLTAEYCQVATELARRVDLTERVDYRQGNALQLPFPDDTFDGAWTQHISMNIRDKRAFFGEMARVVRPGGRLAIYDPIRGNGEEIRLPVPWARSADMSFLVNATETRDILTACGLRIAEWRDVTQKAVDWFKARAASGSGPEPTLGLHLMLGEEWPAMAKNMVENLGTGRIAMLQAVAIV